MASLRRREGYVMIDHRASPGLTADECRVGGLDVPQGIPEGTVFEAAALTCSHCQRVLIRNPFRTRERAYCRGCDHYICDRCAVVLRITLQCQDIRRVLDKLQNDAALMINT